MFESNNTSSHPLNKIIFIKRICSFAAKNPVQGVELARCVNTTFSEALIEYFGFQEILWNIEASASSSSSSLPPTKNSSELNSYPLRRFINKLSHFANTAKWIFIELFQSGLMSCDDAMTFILEGDNEHEISECLKVLFRRLDVDADSDTPTDFSHEWNTTTSFLLSNTPIGRFKEIANKIENEEKKNEHVQVDSSRCAMSESQGCCVENSSRPLFVAMKRNQAKVVKVLLEHGLAEWDFSIASRGTNGQICNAKNNFDSSHFYVKTCENLSVECLQVLDEFVWNRKNEDDEYRDTQRRKLCDLSLAGLLACLSIGHRLSLPCTSKQEIKIQQSLLKKTVEELLTINNKNTEEFPAHHHNLFLDLLNQSILHLCTSNKFASVEILQSLLAFGATSRSKMLNYSYCENENDNNSDSSFLVCQEANLFGLTPLLAAVCNKRKDIVEFLLSLHPEVSASKSLEQSKGGWICKMENDYALWNHQFEEVMKWIVNDEEKNSNVEESRQPEKFTKQIEDDQDDAWPQMSSGWTDDEDEDDDEKKQEKQIVQSPDCPSAFSSPRRTMSHLTLETIISRHKSKVQDSNVIEIFTLILKAKAKEEGGK